LRYRSARFADALWRSPDGAVHAVAKRTLDGAEIDKIIWEFDAHKALALERQRRVDWRECELAASRFRAECDQLDGARLPHLAPDQVP
jgi:hypothetical protein